MSFFRFAARQAFLTYSQVSNEFTRESVFHALNDQYGLAEYVIAEELHADGGRHIHARVTFQHKIDSTDPGLFDISDGANNFHPNIKTILRGASNVGRVDEYILKHDPAPITNVQTKLSWKEMMDGSHSAEEYMGFVKQFYPRDFALNYQRLLAMANAMWPTYGPNTIISSTLNYDCQIPGELLTTELQPNKSLVVIGPAGTGKTSWAKMISPKPALFVRHLDSLTSLMPCHQCIIFDDLDFKHLPPSTQKFLVDVNDLAEIHIRYKVAKIPAGMARIFTANEYPFSEGGEHGRAIDRRIQKVFIQ